MSYSKRFTGSVHYSGSKTVNYPASENGGSITFDYWGDVPIGITIDVETQEFDDSVNGTKAALSLVAGELAATEVAQVAEITAAGERISQHATQGFFRLLASEMSAQVSEFSGRMKAVAGLLVEEGNRVSAVHEQMQTDYQAIKARYTRIFAELDRELDRRVHELDRPAFTLSERVMRRVIDGPITRSAGAVVMQDADLNVAQLKLQTARTKRVASESVGALATVCGYLEDCAREVEGVMDDVPEQGVLFAPVMYAVENDLGGQGTRIVVHQNGLASADTVKRTIISQVAAQENGRTDTALADGHESQAEQDAIDRAFMQRLNRYVSEGGDERVSQMMASMYRKDARQAHRQGDGANA